MKLPFGNFIFKPNFIRLLIELSACFQYESSIDKQKKPLHTTSNPSRKSAWGRWSM